MNFGVFSYILVSGGFWVFALFVTSFYGKSRYHSFTFYALETGSPRALLLDYREGKDAIRVIIFSSQIQKKKHS